MARTDLTVITFSKASEDGVTALSAANVDGHAVANNGQVILEVLNTDVASCTVTVQTPRTIGGLALAEYTVVVAQNERRKFGPFDRATFNNQTGPDAGKMYVDFSHVNNVSVAAWRMPA